MAFVEIIPQEETPNGLTQNLEVSYLLEEVYYGFRFYVCTNLATNNSKWYFDMFDPNTNEDILLGIRLVVGLNLLQQYQKYKNVPPGALLVADLSSPTFDVGDQTWANLTGFDPSLNSFSEQTHKIIYITSDDPELAGRPN